MSGFNCPQTFARAFDNNGAPAPGAKLYAFLAGTTIPKNLYFDFELTQPCPHPLVADSDGNFEQYFLEGGAYKLSLFDQDDNQLRPPEEPIYGTGSVSAATLADVIANSDEIVWTEDEGDQISGHLVWPLVPKAANYVESNASVYKALTGGSGYGTDEIVARRNGTEASRFGVEWGYAGNDAWTGIGDLDGTNIRFQPDAGGAGVDAFGDGAFKFGSLRVGDLAGGGENPLPLARDNDGDLVPRTAEEFRGDIGAAEEISSTSYNSAVVATSSGMADGAASSSLTLGDMWIVNTATGGDILIGKRDGGVIPTSPMDSYMIAFNPTEKTVTLRSDDATRPSYLEIAESSFGLHCGSTGGDCYISGSFAEEADTATLNVFANDLVNISSSFSVNVNSPVVSFSNLAGGGAGTHLPMARDNDGGIVPRTASEFRGDIGVSVADGQVARGTTGGAVTSDAGMAYTLSGGVVNTLSIGTGSSTYSGYRAVITAGQYGFYELAMGAYKRWRFSMDSSAVNTIDAYTSGGAFIDSPWSCANAAGSPITLGGAHAATKRDVSLTKGLIVADLVGTGVRPTVTDATGKFAAQDAATFRGTIGVKERAYAQIYRTGAAQAQSIPNGTTYTKITPFNANDADYLDATPDQANDRIVIGRAGRYHIVFSRSFSVGTANTTWLSAVLKNGTAVPASIQQVKMVNATTSTYATSDCQVTCAAGDVITFGVQHGNGSAVDITYDYSTLYVDALD